MRVQQAVDAQVVACRQADAADLAAAGVDAAIDRQAAAVDADLDHARAHLVAHHQIALLELEAAGAGDAALVQALIQAGEIRQRLRAQGDLGAVIGHARAAGIVLAAGPAQNDAVQRHAAAGRAQRQGLHAAAALVARRQVDDRPGGLDDVAGYAVQFEVAAPAVAGGIERREGASRQVDARPRAQRDVAIGLDGQLARRQRHGRIQRDALRLQIERGAQHVAGGRHGAGARQRQRAAGAQRQRRARLSGQQRRAQRQIAALVAPAFFRHIAVLLVIDVQAAGRHARDHLGRLQVDRGKAQRQPVGRHQRGRHRVGRVVEADDIGRDGQAAVAQAIQHRAAGRRGLVVAQRHVAGHRGPDRAGPDEFRRTDARRVARRAIAIHRRRAQHQPPQGRGAGRGAGVQRHRAIHVDGFGGIEDQAFQRGRAQRRIAAQQPRQGILVQRQSGRQLSCRGSLGQRLRRAQIQAGHAQHQVARAVLDVVAQREGAVGGGADGAFGHQARGSRADTRAGADVDGHTAVLRRRSQVDQPIGQDQRAVGLDRIVIAATRVLRRRPQPDGGQDGPLLDGDIAVVG